MSKHSVPVLTTGLPVKAEGAASVRDALRALIHWRSVGEAAGELDAPRAELRGIATPFENRAQLLRENARAAYRSVVGAHELDGCDSAALETALDVVMAAWRSAVEVRDAHAEALKSIRLYDPDPRVRALAGASLAGSAAVRGSRPLADGYDA